LTNDNRKENIMDEIKKIMVALSFSEHAAGIFNYSEKLAKSLGAELIVVNIVNSRDVQAIASIANMGYELDPEKYVKELKEERKSALEEVVKDSSFSLDDLTLILKVGNPIDELLKITVKENVDMIVMGIKGRTDLENILIGSVAEKLFRRSPVTVVSYRDEKNMERLKNRIQLT